MRTVQDMFKECNFKDILLVLMPGVPEKYFSKMLEQYYSLYCAMLEAWDEYDPVDWILTDFRQAESVKCVINYHFYGMNPEKSGVGEVNRIDWDLVISGKIKLYIPDCIDEDFEDYELLSMFLRQMYLHRTIYIPKNENKKLFGYIRSLPLDRRSHIPAMERVMEMKIHFRLDKSAIYNAVLEYEESKCRSFKWGELIANDDPLDVYVFFHRLDPENPPAVSRLHRFINRMESQYSSIELRDYYNVTNDGFRIIVEENNCCKKLPLIYVRDSCGSQTPIEEIEFSDLLCMEIHVLDKRITEPEQILSLIAFYLEYPIRVERIQKKYFIQSIIGMKMRDFASL